jgi:predicted DNA-binding WGR domain protein
MRRFYALSLQPDLFGTVSVVRESGRIGQPGTVRYVVCADETAARAALALRMNRKIKRGYQRIGSQDDAEDLRPS